MGGDCITTHLVPLSTGVNMLKAAIDIALGNRPKLTPSLSRGAAIRYIMPPVGIIKSISGVSEAECMDGVKLVEITKHRGETGGTVKSSTDRLGFVITQADTAEQATALAEKATEIIRPETV